MNLYGPFHFRPWIRYTSTGEPAGRLRNRFDISVAFGPLGAVRRMPVPACNSRSEPAAMAFSIDVALSSCVGEGLVRAGRGIAPKTRRMGQSNSGPVVELTAWKERNRKSSGEVACPMSKRIRLYALRRGAWYFSTTPMVPGF